MFVLDLFNTKYEKELRTGAVDKVVSEGGPYDLPGIDYDRPGDAPRRPKPSGGTTPRRHPDDPDFMDPDQRRLRAEQERLKKAWAEKNKGVAEASREMTGTARDQFISRMTPGMDANALRQKVAKIVNSPGFTEDTILQIVDAGDNISHPAGRYIQQAFHGLQYNLGKEYEDYPERVAEKLLHYFRSMLPAYRLAEGFQHHFIYEGIWDKLKQVFSKPPKYTRPTQKTGESPEDFQARVAAAYSKYQDEKNKYNNTARPQQQQSDEPPHPSDDDYIGHGTAENELRMFMAGQKPAAIVSLHDLPNWKNLIDSGKYVIKQLTAHGKPNSVIIAQPGENQRVEQLYKLVQNATDAGDRGDFRAYENSNYHRWVGKLLGYPEDKINAFIEKYFRNRTDLAKKPVYEQSVAESTGQDRKSWMASIQQQHPTVKFVQAKMPGAPIMALVNGKPVAQWDGKTGVAEGPESEYDIRQMLDKHDRDVEDLGIVGQGEHWAGIQQAKQRRIEKEKEQKKRKAVDEETDPFGGYQQSPRAFGVGNFQRIVKANMGNLPTVTLEFADPNDNILLDKKGIDLISDYYDGLENDSRKNHFIYRVLPSADEVLTVLKRLGWHEAVQPELPGIPTQGELPLQEKKRVGHNTDAGDVKVARELQKLRAQYPAARSDVEVVAKSEIDSNERSQQQLAAINGANTEQDQLLKQLVALDRKQGSEIGNLDNENDRLEQQLKHVERTNAQLAQTIDQMTGRAKSGTTNVPRSQAIDLLPNAPADTPDQSQPATAPKPSEPQEPNQPANSDAIGRMAQDLAQPRKVQGINSDPPPASIRFDEPSNVTDISQHRANLTKQARAAMKNKDFKPLAKAMIDKGVLSRTGTDEGLLDFVTKKQPATKTKSEPIDPMIAKIVSNRQNPQSRVPRAKAKVYHGYDEYNRAKAVGDVEESTVNEFAPGQGGSSGNYFQALASAWYNGVFNTGSLPKGIKSQVDVERLLNRGIVAPDGKMRKYHIDYNSDFNGVEIYSDDYYEHGDLDGNDGRTGQPWGPYDFMAFSDDQLDEAANPAQQAAIAINMKKHHKKPKGDLNELSTDKLAQYKTAAALDAGAADKAGNYERGDKRFAGIIKATKKQFANDVKKHGQQGMAEGLTKEPTNRKEYLDQRDRLFRMMSMETNPANKQIIKQALKDLEARHGHIKNTVKEESSTASDAVERAILNRIMTQHTDLLMKFGPEKVMQAAEEVAYGVGDVDEIGTSDVSAYVNQVRQILGA